ncbi:MAG TPA: glycoside hydrolase family 130 protein [Flavisolibacter sp.]|nr:glycoside hydrolase family 130 protein [Flavisolibacter sp.]
MRKQLYLFILFLISLAATSQEKHWMLAPFVKADANNPCLISSGISFVDPILKKSVAWEEKDVFNPAAVVRNGKIYLLYRAEDKIGKHAGTSRIGLAASSDGLHFTKRKTPVLYPKNDAFKKYEWEGGCEDPRIVETRNGNYVLTYTAYDGKVARLLIGTSKDLINWKKHGPVFTGADRDLWSKSGAIISRRVGSKMIAEKVNGKYWMYWGDTDIFLATSDDLVKWTPVIDKTTGKLLAVISPRAGMFDSDLVEPGPPAMITKNGILLIYNSRNKDQNGDPKLPSGTYTAGQALLSLSDPTKLIDRSENYFMKPDKEYEITGQVNNVVFLEGLVYFKKKWFMYYGTADSKIAVAVKE